jgi:hypothetical protein
MRNKKRAATFGLALVLLIVGVSGCMLEKFADSLLTGNKETVQEALAYMSEKYGGQEFVYYSHDYIYGELNLYCYPEWGAFETEKVLVQRKEVNGEVRHTDNYFSILIREDAEAEVMTVCADLGLKAKAFMYTNDFEVNNQFDSSKTYEDFVKWGAEDGSLSLQYYRVLIETDEVIDYEFYADEILRNVMAKNIAGILNIYFCTRDQYEYYQRENLKELQDITPKISFFKTTY